MPWPVAAGAILTPLRPRSTSDNKSKGAPRRAQHAVALDLDAARRVDGLDAHGDLQEALAHGLVVAGEELPVLFCCCWGCVSLGLIEEGGREGGSPRC